MTGEKSALLKKDQVSLKMYVCGLTVYDEAHIGHLRCMLVFDLLVRFLRSLHLEVMFVRNITDVDDKIIKRANEEGIEWRDLVDSVIHQISKQEAELGLVKPDAEPRASDYMPQMIELIKKLEDKGYAYVSQDGDVCFAVNQYEDYGCLSGQKLDALIAGQRIEVRGKRSAADFVLWKQGKPGEPFWDSPWGKGRPGWHIECSAMSLDLLGTEFDLHGGGSDLKFPHHENEIAQSVCATGGDFARHWMHVGPLRVNNEKMSKSLGNFITVRSALESYHPELLKLYLLKTHYRQPLNYSKEGIEQCQQVLIGMYLAVWDIPTCDADEQSDWWQSFSEALSDDLNTAQALTVMHDLTGKMMVAKEAEKAQLCALLIKMGGVLGVLQESPKKFLQGDKDASLINSIIERRNIARQQRDFAVADELRDSLDQEGVSVLDAGAESKWYNRYSGINYQ